MAASNLRFGTGVTREVGMDMKNLLSQLPAQERSQAKIGVYTDPRVAQLDVMKVVEQSLIQEGLNWVVYDRVSVEPTDKSWRVGLVSLVLTSADTSRTRSNSPGQERSPTFSPLAEAVQWTRPRRPICSPTTQKPISWSLSMRLSARADR